ncbi:MAG TPA: amidase family protein, partial [bacterium]|nr:amidase family protein [bacterium]
MNLHSLTISEASEKLAKGEVTSRELTEAVLKRIEAIDPNVGAFITVTKELALEQADASDKRRKEGRAIGPLDGIPIALKDCVLTKGIKTTDSSKILNDFIPPYDATVWKRLK